MEERSVMLNFLDTIKEISPSSPNLLHVQKLQLQLRCLSKFLIQENDAQLLMECILKYIDFIINVSLLKGFRDQIKICRNSFSIITEIISEQVQTTFIKTITKRVFDIIIEDDVKNWCVKKELLKAYISCIQRVDKSIRQETVRDLPNFYLFKMVDSISTYGDYDLQVTLIETVFRMYGKSTITSKLKDLIPESQQLSECFAEINGETFDEDVRNFLNALNETSGKLFSIMCKSVHLGSIKCGELLDNFNGLWVDFNLSDKAITWYCNKNSFSHDTMDADDLDDRVWNLITLFVSDVESVQIHRPVKSEDILIYFKFKEPCISSFDDNQAIIGAANNLTLVVSYDSKKITVLLSKVLPYLFKNKFFHNSSKVSSSKKSIYKPLNVTVSRRTKSDSSKTKSDTSSFVIYLDPISGKSSKSDISSTFKDAINLDKGANRSSVSSKCEVVSIPDSSTPATELSLEFAPNKDEMVENVKKTIDSEYGTAEMYPNIHCEINPKVSKNTQDTDMEKPVDIKILKAKIGMNTNTHFSLNDELLSAQEDINQIQTISRECAQLSKNSRLTDSTSKKLPNLSRSNDDQIAKGYVYLEQHKDNITLCNKLTTQESSTSIFESATDGSVQALTKPTKISRSTDLLQAANIYKEKNTNESYTHNFETADKSQTSNNTIKVSTPKDTLQQYAFSQNFQKIVNNDLNLNKHVKINKLTNMTIEASGILTRIVKSRTMTTIKEHVKSDILHGTEQMHAHKPNEIDVENAIFHNNLIKDRHLPITTEEFGSINFPKVNYEHGLLKDSNVLCSIDQNTAEALTSAGISNSRHLGCNKMDSKQTKNNNNSTLNEINYQPIATLDITDGINILNQHNCNKNHIKCSTAINQCLSKKKKQRHTTKSDESNEAEIESSSKINNKRINSLSKMNYSVEQSIVNIKCENEQQKNVKLLSSNNVNSNKIQDYGSSCKIENINIKGDSQLLADKKTENEDAVIIEEQISCKTKILEVAEDYNSRKCSGVLDDEANNKKGITVRHTNSTDPNLIGSSIKNFTDATDFKNTHEALILGDDISSEDEIPLNQLAEKWKREKLKVIDSMNIKEGQATDNIKKENQNLHIALEKTKSFLTGNREGTFIDLKKETVSKYINFEKQETKSQIVRLDNNAISIHKETFKFLGGKLVNSQKSTNNELNDRVEFNKQLDNSEFIINNIFDTDEENDKEQTRSNEESVDIKTGQNKNKTHLSDENYNGSVTISKSYTTKDFNRTVATLDVKKKRKLYNPEDLTHLEDSILDNLSTKLAQNNSPTQPNTDKIALTISKSFNKTSDPVIPLVDCDIKMKRSRKKPRTPIEPKEKNIELTNFKKIGKPNADLNNYNIKFKRPRILKTPNELKVVNPNTTLKSFNNRKSRYNQLRPVFYNLLESFRKEVGTSFEKILKEQTPKENFTKNRCLKDLSNINEFANKNRSTRIDMNVRTQKLNMSLSSSSSLSLNFKKTYINGNSETPPPFIISNNCPLPELYVEKNNHERKINIISDIQIRPKRMLVENEIELSSKKVKTCKFELKHNLPQRTTQFNTISEPMHIEKNHESERIVPLEITRETHLPVISKNITDAEISSWIITGSPKYTQFSEKHFVLKHCCPMFESLLTPQDSSQEYRDVLKIFNILKKYC